jgi:hypothetical protein
VTIFLIIMIPVSAFLGFTICAILQIAGEADRREERYLAEQAQKKAVETQENKEADT